MNGDLEDKEVIENGTEWLEFKCTAYEPAKNWWKAEKPIELYVNIKRDSIVSVLACSNDATKTVIWLVNGKYHIVNMTYEKVMELV